MIWIAHRGNLNGPVEDKENHPDQIDCAISKGFDVEIDVWRFGENRWYLGHDGPDHKIDLVWLLERKSHLWVHCKNAEALTFLSAEAPRINHFWHENDEFTLTSKGFIWAYPSRYVHDRAISVMPEMVLPLKQDSFLLPNGFMIAGGICSDYIDDLRWVNKRMIFGG